MRPPAGGTPGAPTAACVRPLGGCQGCAACRTPTPPRGLLACPTALLDPCVQPATAQGLARPLAAAGSDALRLRRLDGGDERLPGLGGVGAHGGLEGRAGRGRAHRAPGSPTGARRGPLSSAGGVRPGSSTPSPLGPGGPQPGARAPAGPTALPPAHAAFWHPPAARRPAAAPPGPPRRAGTATVPGPAPRRVWLGALQRL